MGTRAAVVDAFSALDFAFEERPTRTGQARSLGFAPDAVLEVAGDRGESVSLLFSANAELDAHRLRSPVCVLALATATGVDFISWLATQFSQRGLSAPWKSSREFGPVDVSAEFLSGDAVLLTLVRRDLDLAAGPTGHRVARKQGLGHLRTKRVRWT